MRLEWVFRVSGYATLALACLSVALAASPFVAGLELLIVPVLLILVIECCLEGRVTLPAWAANLLGVAIAGGGMMWMGWQLYGHLEETGLEDVAMPAALLPFLGPVLIVLMLVKLLRPKQSVDYWVLQALGLVLVLLSCVLASEPASGMILLAYLVCGLWHLAIFHLRRETVTASGGPKKPVEPARVPLVGSLARAALWSGAALTIGLPLFLLLPRQGQSAWNPYQLFGGAKPTGSVQVLQTGFSNEIDLNSTDVVEITDDVALTVQVHDNAGRPKLDLNSDQRWRGAVLEHYANGRWVASAPLTMQIPSGSVMPSDVEPKAIPQAPAPQGAPPVQEAVPAGQLRQTSPAPGPPPPRKVGSAVAGDRLPDLGPNQFFVTFAFQPRIAGGFFLVEPVVSPHNPRVSSDPTPVVSYDTDPAQIPLFQELRQTLQPGVHFGRGEYYRQVTRPAAEPDLSEPVDRFKPTLVYLRARRADTTGVGAWTERLLDRLAADAAFGLTPNDVERVSVGRSGDKFPRNEEKVAVALTEYLAHSGDYTYTLERRRADTSIDPVLDFLQNVKQGHCERFAGALALMLRSQGIPARVVTGFRGAESRGDGIYAIRQNFAHSWVEVLVERKGRDGVVHWQWRMLDPTPSTDAPAPTPFSLARWWDNHRRKGETIWKELIVNYESETQDALLHDSWQWLSQTSGTSVAGAGDFSWRSLAFLVLAAAVAVPAFRLAFRLRPRSRSRSASRSWDVPFYNRLLVLLARHIHLRPKASQTPREFAETVRGLLAASPTTTELAGVPARLAELLYRIRYGARPLSNDEARSIEEDLRRLAAGLAGG